MKNKVTVMVMAIISFIVMPYACNKGLSNLYEMWDTVEEIKLSVMSAMPLNLSKYIAGISIENAQKGFNWFLIGICGLGFATMVYCNSKRAYSYGFIIAALADSMNILNRIVYNYGFSFDRNELIVLGMPFAMWLGSLIIGAIIKGKCKILFSAIAAVLTCWGIYSYLNGQMYYDISLVIMGSMTILGSWAMQQMDI